MKIMWSRVNLTNRFVKFTPIQVISIVWLNKRGGSSCHIISKSSMGTKLLRGDTKITSNRREELTRIRMLIGAAFRIKNDCFTCTKTIVFMLRIYWKLSDVNPGHESFSGIQKPSQWTNTGWENIFLYALPIVSDRIFRYQ